MRSDQYSSFGYGYGYWNGYGVTSQLPPETNSGIESTSYRVFSQDNKGLPFKMDMIPPEDYASMLWENHTVRTGLNDESPNYPANPNEDDSEISTLMEFLENLYIESHELFEKVFSQLMKKYKQKKGNKEEQANAKAFRKLLKKLAMRLFKKKMGEMKVQTMRRSLSLGSPRTPFASEEESNLKLERFKSKTFEAGGAGGGGSDIQQGGQGATR